MLLQVDEYRNCFADDKKSKIVVFLCIFAYKGNSVIYTFARIFYIQAFMFCFSVLLALNYRGLNKKDLYIKFCDRSLENQSLWINFPPICLQSIMGVTSKNLWCSFS
jgi:hypothetical protein